ncbi:MAG TPA: DUF3306 domain-containing protein [Acidiferrobacterales bacterium]|nr:DUF3306 domain-containing protein [Acidiferrobacterales bacterium]
MGLKTAMIPKNKPNAGSDDAGGLRESDGEPGFLRRWSRRKAQARQVPKPQPSTPPNEPTPEAVSAEAAPVIKRDATDADLPSIDQLDENSDYSAFMSPKVSEHLRRTALRKLFHTPQFNVIDPVDQFALDWNGFTPLGSIITHDMLAATEREAAKLGEKAREKLLDANDAQQPVDAVLPAESRDAALGRALEPAGTDRREPPSTGPATAGAPAGKPTESNTGT